MSDYSFDANPNFFSLDKSSGRQDGDGAQVSQGPFDDSDGELSEEGSSRRDVFRDEPAPAPVKRGWSSRLLGLFHMSSDDSQTTKSRGSKDTNSTGVTPSKKYHEEFVKSKQAPLAAQDMVDQDTDDESSAGPKKFDKYKSSESVDSVEDGDEENVYNPQKPAVQTLIRATGSQQNLPSIDKITTTTIPALPPPQIHRYDIPVKDRSSSSDLTFDNLKKHSQISSSASSSSDQIRTDGFQLQDTFQIQEPRRGSAEGHQTIVTSDSSTTNSFIDGQQLGRDSTTYPGMSSVSLSRSSHMISAKRILDMEYSRSKSSARWRLCRILIMLCAMSSIAGGIAIIVLENRIDASVETVPQTPQIETDAFPTSAPSYSPIDILEVSELLEPTLGYSAALVDTATPQYQALRWLSDKHDRGTLNPDNIVSVVQRFVLAVLHYSFKYVRVPDTTMSAVEWLSPGRHECDWGAVVSCNGALEITDLDFSANELGGSFAPEIQFLGSALTSLQLNENFLKQTIPTQLALLTNLENLELQNNELQGTIPLLPLSLITLDLSRNFLIGNLSKVETLSSLELLDVSNNDLTGAVFSFVAMRQLQTLNLRQNRFAGQFPSGLSSLSALSRIHLDHNSFSGTLPDFFDFLIRRKEFTISNNLMTGTLSSAIPEDQLLAAQQAYLNGEYRLQRLDLSRNSFEGVIPELYEAAPKLEWIDVSYNRFTGTVFGYSGSSVKHINFASNSLTGTLPTKFGRELEFIDYSNNRLGSTIPSSLGDLVKLSYLDVGANRGLTGILPGRMGNLRHLTSFGAYNCSLSGRLPTSLGKLTKLASLRLGGNNFIGSIPEDYAYFLRLVELRLDSNLLTGTLPRFLGAFSYLEWLFLQNNRIAGTIPLDLGYLTKLEILDLSGNEVVGSVPPPVCVLGSSRHGSLRSIYTDPCRLACNCTTCVETVCGGS